jgi:hypothetical protein
MYGKYILGKLMYDVEKIFWTTIHLCSRVTN